jgi:hypothetical protein
MLERVRVASPCTADWEQMVGDDRVRFCSQCNLNVYNLAAMTRREAENLIADREGRLCARLYRRADGKVLTRDCPVGFRAVVRKVSRMAGAALSAMMSVSFATAQNPSEHSAAQPLVQITPVNQTEVALTVIDPSGAVIANATIRIVNRSTHEEVHGKTDVNGLYKLATLTAGTYEITVESPGFKPYKKQVVLKQGEMLKQEITLKIGDFSMGGVIVEVPQALPASANVDLIPRLRSTK